MTKNPTGKMWTIYTNVPITRRKSYFLVCHPDGVCVFRHRHFWPCVRYLEAEQQTEYLISPAEDDGPADSHLVVLHRSI